MASVHQFVTMDQELIHGGNRRSIHTGFKGVTQRPLPEFECLGSSKQSINVIIKTGMGALLPGHVLGSAAHVR